jgi:hypothetical protein
MSHPNYPTEKALPSYPPSSPTSATEIAASPAQPHTPTPNHQDLANLLQSPTLPSSPAPAYTALPYRDIDFYCAPVLQGIIGDIELETIDGKKFLVHKRVLEQETIFFHI